MLRLALQVLPEPCVIGTCLPSSATYADVAPVIVAVTLTTGPQNQVVVSGESTAEVITGAGTEVEVEVRGCVGVGVVVGCDEVVRDGVAVGVVDGVAEVVDLVGVGVALG